VAGVNQQLRLNYDCTKLQELARNEPPEKKTQLEILALLRGSIPELRERPVRLRGSDWESDIDRDLIFGWGSALALH
jgi:hypothetical protein